ncbi:MAG: phospho-N-acetylmuramoyl-pentapeptide-transferase, partial [Imperialibacter sp.]
MLYYLFDYLESEFNLMGASVFRFISFRAGMAALISLLITVIFGKYLIGMLRKYQLGEEIRDLGLQGQMEKKGTPTMGGIIIIMAIVIPTLLFAQLENIYIILMLVTAISMGSIGFLDDYLKLKKKNKDGLAGKFKIIGQVSVGLLVG